jgi:hypothetical protein
MENHTEPSEATVYQTTDDNVIDRSDHIYDDIDNYVKNKMNDVNQVSVFVGS